MNSDETDLKQRVRKMLSLKQVLRIVPIARSTLLLMEGDGRFPKSHTVSNKKVWFEEQIIDWQNDLK